MSNSLQRAPDQASYHGRRRVASLMVLVLVLMKLGLDVSLHLREHKRLAEQL